MKKVREKERVRGQTLIGVERDRKLDKQRERERER